MSTSASRQLAKIMLVVGCLLLGLVIAGCNTVEGAGKDIESAGEGIQDAAD